MQLALKSFDYVIVGGGSAGCVLANRLSKNPQNKVMLIEHGPPDTSKLIHIPIGFPLMLGGWVGKEYTYHDLYSEPEINLNNRKTFQPRGRTLGGSSSLNAMIYIRGNKYDYDQWNSLLKGAVNNTWSYESVLESFKSFENNQTFKNDPFHGTGGELGVTSASHVCETSSNFVEAFQEQGVMINPDFNGKNQEGCGINQRTIINGERCSSAKAFLSDEVKNRPNLKIITDMKVLGITLDSQKKATAVKVGTTEKLEQQSSIEATKEIILCAGAFGTPQVLQLSGIGNPKDISVHNIKIQHELWGVGQNLQDHLDLTIGIKTKRGDLPNFHHSQAIDFAKEVKKYSNPKEKEQSFLSSNIADAGAFLSVDSSSPAPDTQFHAISSHQNPHCQKFVYDTGAILHSCFLRPYSRGTVTLHNSNPFSLPKINMNYLSDIRDLQFMIKGARFTQTILRSKLFKDNSRGFNFAELENDMSDDSWEKYIRQQAETIYHPVGTCRMGIDDQSVVGPTLKVHGISNLRVADASIMPTLISGNTNAPTMMIADKCASFILQGI